MNSPPDAASNSGESMDAGPEKPESRTIVPMSRVRGRRAIEGLVLGALIGLCASRLGLNSLLHLPILQDIIVLPAIFGALLALSRARRLLHITAAVFIAAILVIGYTPLMPHLMPLLSRSDALVPVPAVVVLSTSVHRDNTLDGNGQERLLHGYLLVKQGYAGRLVLTRSIPIIGDQTPLVLAQIGALDLAIPTDAVGPVENTHDEALAVARLARERGWTRVILVTQPWHMRRARGVFVKAGLEVLCSPCVEGTYDISNLSGPPGRLEAFSDWLHETVGYGVYRLRGWL